MKMENGTVKMFRLSFWLEMKGYPAVRFIVDEVYDTYEKAKEYTRIVDSETKFAREWCIDCFYRTPEDKK